MKFLVDAQLPRSLSEYLKQKGFDSVHTIDLPQRNKTKDNEIIRLAAKESRIVITKDSDFLGSFLVKAEPGKLIMVKTGNIPNKELIRLFDNTLEIIITMIARSNLVEITKTDIAEHE